MAPITDYASAVDYLLSFADFERSSNVRREAEQFALTRITSLLARLDRPQDGRTTVHVAGSKGKGSTAAMIESISRAAGLSTGLYTSPDLHGKNERIRLNGEPISEPAFAVLVEQLRPVIDAELEATPGRLSTFEILTAMAFVAFRDHNVDIQIVEVGLGGRLDTTNVFREKAVSVITALSREHTEILGDSIEKIAAEKAGIITAGAAVAVLGPQRSDASATTVRYAITSLTSAPCFRSSSAKSSRPMSACGSSTFSPRTSPVSAIAWSTDSARYSAGVRSTFSP